MDHLIELHELSQHVGYCVENVRKKLKVKGITGFKIGHQKYFDRATVLAVDFNIKRIRLSSIPIDKQMAVIELFLSTDDNQVTNIARQLKIGSRTVDHIINRYLNDKCIIIESSMNG